MKRKLCFILFLCFHVLLWANKNNFNYYDINQIRVDFPSSTVEQKVSNADTVTIHNSLQGYVIILTHYPDEASARKIYYDTLREAASQNLLDFFSNTGYTTFIDAERGIVYGFIVENSDFIVVRFYNIDIIPSIIKIVDEKMESWKKI